jgi:acetyl-CoA acetyltransferase
MSLALEACRSAITDAGLRPQDIDGMAGTNAAAPRFVVGGIGVPELRWWGVGTDTVVGFRVVDAMNAIFSGACETALIYSCWYRGPRNSRSAAQDPFRARAAAMQSAPGLRGGQVNPHVGFHVPLGQMNADYAGWMARYMYEYGATREDFGLVAINGRTNAAMNELAVLREPITMQDYLAARMVREPMCILDMDIPIDGADAMVLTTAERARSLRKKPVYIHAASYGMTDHPEPDQAIDLRHTGQQIAIKALWEKSEIKLEDIDIYFPYDGFSIIALNWIENVGWCKKGEAGGFLRQHWDKTEARVKVNGKMPFNTHGGSLSEGATQGTGHLREAVLQLRGEAGRRQVPDAKTALVDPGGMNYNAQTFVFRTD